MPERMEIHRAANRSDVAAAHRASGGARSAARGGRCSWDHLQTLRSDAGRGGGVPNISRDLHPAWLGRQLQRIPSTVNVYTTRFKAGRTDDAVMSEIGAVSDRHPIHARTVGQVMAVC